MLVVTGCAFPPPIARQWDASETAKMAFMTHALQTSTKGKVEDVELQADVLNAIQRIAELRPAEIIAKRKEITRGIEERASILCESGRAEQWFDNCDDLVRQVSQEVNGPLCAEIACDIAFHDEACVDLFRRRSVSRASSDFGQRLCDGVFSPHFARRVMVRARG